MAFQAVGTMESGAVSYQIAVSTAVLQDREDFFLVPEEHATSTSDAKCFTTLNFDSSKISKSFVKEEVVDDGQKLFWCALCGENFDNFKSLDVHLKSHADKNELKNSDNYYVTHRIDNNNISPNKNEGGKPYKCSICDKTFVTWDKLCDHKKIHAGIQETPFQCPWCGKKFTHGKCFHKHVMSKHKGDDASAPSVCAKMLQSRHTFENRLVVYTGEGVKRYKCALCSKTFRRLFRLKEHTRTHSGEKHFQCSVCSKTFNSSGNLSRHIKKVHNGGAPLPKAEKNPKATTLVNDFEKHTIIQVEGPLDIPVQEIQQAVHDIQFLNAPRRTIDVDDVGQNSNHPTYFIDLRADGDNQLEVVQQDTANGAFQCSLCGKTFATSSLLTKHIYTHKLEVSAKCSVCSKTFKAESYLRRHMILHSGEKPYKCTFCPKAFFRQYSLNNHLRTHTGEKPYHCSVCGKSFAVSDNMYRHIKKMHKGEGLERASDMVKQIQEMNRDKNYCPPDPSIFQFEHTVL